jgi:hypothetical protein
VTVLRRVAALLPALRLSCSAAALAAGIASHAAAQGAPATRTAAPAKAAAPSAGKLAAIDELLAVTDMERTMAQSTEQMLRAQLQAMPQLAPFEDVLRQFYGEQLSWKAMKPDLVTIYADVFTEQEIRDVTAFYRTPLGKTMMAKMPQIMARSAELSQQHLQAALPQLMSRIQARAAELQRQGKAPTAAPGPSSGAAPGAAPGAPSGSTPGRPPR